MAILDRAKALQAQDLNSERVSVPEWGGDVLVWQMPEKRRNDFDRWNKEQCDKSDYSQFNARLAADTVGDESGALLFTHEDIPALLEKSCVVLRRLAAVALRVNKMRKEDDEDAVKNSGSDLGGSSPSTSQES